jgi:hypothetical protein
MKEEQDEMVFGESATYQQLFILNEPWLTFLEKEVTTK